MNLFEFTQWFWERLHNLALRRMNYGYGGNFRTSGELYVARYINNRLSGLVKIIIFDIGANHGEFSKEISLIFNKRAHIYAFEPSQKAFAKLNENLFNFSNVSTFNYGFSDVNSITNLHSNSEGSGLASLYRRRLDHYGIYFDKAEQAVFKTIDSYCKENNIERINFLKLDIEGHELSALLGAKQMISELKVDFIQFEFGGTNIDSKTYFQDFFYLLKDIYSVYRITKNGIYELKSYDESLEIFKSINFLAIRKSLI